MGRPAKAKANKKGSRGRRSTRSDEADEAAEPAPAAEIASPDETEMTSAANSSAGTIGVTPALESEVAALQLSPPDDSSDNGDTETTSVINKLDNIDEAIDWILQHPHKVDFKRIAKHLPHTAQDLRNGSVDPCVLADKLTRVTWGFAAVDQIAPMLSERVVRSRADKELNQEFSCSLKDKLRRCVIDVMLCKQLPGVAEFPFYEILKKVFDETWFEWEARISDRLFRGRRLTFRRYCPLFNAPVESFAEMSWEILEDCDAEWGQRLYDDLRLAASHVSDDLDFVKETCWECGKLESTNACERCNVAIYCGRECQVKAWKSGHKNACCELKLTNEEYADSLAVVDAAYEAGGMVHGIKLSDDDYHLLHIMIAKQQIFQQMTGFNDEVKRPSMTIFYENLGRVVRGEWWLYSDTNTVAEYQLALQRDGGDELEYFSFVAALLCYDHQAHAGNDVFDSLPVLIQNSVGFCESMPAARYLEIYKQNVENSFDRSKLKRVARTKALREFRRILHKA